MAKPLPSTARLCEGNGEALRFTFFVEEGQSPSFRIPVEEGRRKAEALLLKPPGCGLSPCQAIASLILAEIVTK